MLDRMIVGDRTSGWVCESVIGALPDAPRVDDGLVEGHTRAISPIAGPCFVCGLTPTSLAIGFLIVPIIRPLMIHKAIRPSDGAFGSSADGHTVRSAESRLRAISEMARWSVLVI